VRRRSASQKHNFKRSEGALTELVGSLRDCGRGKMLSGGMPSNP
jgi:hypothetical protein